MLKKYALFLCTVLFVFTSCYQSAEHETGSVSFSFARTAIDFEGDFNFVFTLVRDTFPYTGAPNYPVPSVRATVGATSGVFLEQGKDYKTTYSNNVNAGTGTLTITGIGNYQGVAAENFSITSQDISDGEDATPATVDVEKAYYDGTNPSQPVLTVTDYYGNSMKEGTDYNITWLSGRDT